MEAVQQVHCCTLLKIFKMCVNFIRKRSILQSGSGWVVFPKIASYLTTRFAFSKRGRGSGIAPPVTLYRFVSTVAAVEMVSRSRPKSLLTCLEKVMDMVIVITLIAVTVFWP